MSDEETWPPLGSPIERDERERLRPWAIVVWLLCLVAAGIILAA